jgi:2,4-dienoyl-CoA reductase-like NADH-dependent reductase (Old Yellow Enzyme family)
MTIQYLKGKDSSLFQPLTISNGNITLEHRVVHAPLTRNRGEPLQSTSTPDHPNRIWVPGDVVVEYYSQRATKGGLIISEGIPPSLEVSILLIRWLRKRHTVKTFWGHQKPK